MIVMYKRGHYRYVTKKRKNSDGYHNVSPDTGGAQKWRGKDHRIAADLFQSGCLKMRVSNSEICNSDLLTIKFQSPRKLGNTSAKL